MTEKEEIIKEIITFPLSYALLYNLKVEKGWDEEKLNFTDLHILKDRLCDMKTMERNKKQWNGEN